MTPGAAQTNKMRRQETTTTGPRREPCFACVVAAAFVATAVIVGVWTCDVWGLTFVTCVSLLLATLSEHRHRGAWAVGLAAAVGGWLALGACLALTTHPGLFERRGHEARPAAAFTPWPTAAPTRRPSAPLTPRPTARPTGGPTEAPTPGPTPPPPTLGPTAAPARSAAPNATAANDTTS